MASNIFDNDEAVLSREVLDTEATNNVVRDNNNDNDDGISTEYPALRRVNVRGYKEMYNRVIFKNALIILSDSGKLLHKTLELFQGSELYSTFWGNSINLNVQFSNEFTRDQLSKNFSDGVALINGKVIPVVNLTDKSSKNVTSQNYEEIISSLDKITSISFNIYIASDLSDEYQIILTIIHELCIHAVRFAKIMTMRGLSFKARVAKIFEEDAEEHHQDILNENSLYNKCIDDLLYNCTSNYEQYKSPFRDSIHVVNAAFDNGETIVNWYNKSLYNGIIYQAAICEKSGGDHYIGPESIVFSLADITLGGGRRDGHRIAYTKKM